MKKTYLTVAMAIAIMGSCTLQSCIGSFALSNKLLAWNKTIDNKFVNELVFFAFLIVPVYEVSFLADVLVLNSIEFWSGESPVAQGKTIIDGKDGKYLVECDGKGYSIQSLADGSVMRLNFDSADKSWSVVGVSGQEYKLLSFVDDTHVKVPAANGADMIVELSNSGLFAYEAAVVNE